MSVCLSVRVSQSIYASSYRAFERYFFHFDRSCPSYLLSFLFQQRQKGLNEFIQKILMIPELAQSPLVTNFFLPRHVCACIHACIHSHPCKHTYSLVFPCILACFLSCFYHRLIHSLMHSCMCLRVCRLRWWVRR